MEEKVALRSEGLRVLMGGPWSDLGAHLNCGSFRVECPFAGLCG